MNVLTGILKPIIAAVQVILVLFGFQPAKQHRPLPAEGPVNVLVTGLLGYGEESGLSFPLPYFGSQDGLVNICDELEAAGYESYVTAAGPMSSAWDRACELYAELTGTRVDYGEAHSKQYGHERYGREHSEPLFEGWSAQRPVNLIGHSFGGATARVFAMLCDEGSAAEREATSAAERSPLFTGGMLDRINAIVTLASPHNGTTAFVAMPDEYSEFDFLWLEAAVNIMGNDRLISRLYDLQLDHFGLSDPPQPFGQFNAKYHCFEAVRKFLQSRDHAFYDLSLDGAAKINQADKIRPGVKYLSYSASLTDDIFGYHVPAITELGNPVLWVVSMQVGLDLGKTTSPSPEWRENDGAVPLPSALYPDGQPHQDAPAKGLKPGVWNVMPTVHGVDHAYLAGSDPVRNGREEVMGIYLDMMDRIK